MTEIVPILNLGLGGLGLWVVYKLVSNHLNHHTEALYGLTTSVKELIEYLKNHHKNG